MNVISMMNEILTVTNPMICEASLPDFRSSPNKSAERVRIAAFDELYGALDGDVLSGRE